MSIIFIEETLLALFKYYPHVAPHSHNSPSNHIPLTFKIISRFVPKQIFKYLPSADYCDWCNLTKFSDIERLKTKPTVEVTWR